MKWTAVPLVVMLLCCGCGNNRDFTIIESGTETETREETALEQRVETEIEETTGMEAEKSVAEAVSLTVSLPVASGENVEQNERSIIDYSNTRDGYVMVRFVDDTNQRLKVQVTGPSIIYTYDLPMGIWATFPLSDGDGSYKVTVYENISDSKYATVLSTSFQVALSDEFAPFLRPNQYVDYSNATNTIAKAAELVSGLQDSMQKIEKIYEFVVDNLTYDTEKAASVKSGYLPVLDDVLAQKTGICFDYAALMAGMLRSQGIPCKLVVGYADTAYHAWVSVWTEEEGWIDKAIYFDGKSWQRMDPTFASSGGGNKAIMEYIGDGSNYTAKFLY